LWTGGSSIFAVREAINQKAKAESAFISATDGLQIDLSQARETTIAAVESLNLAEDALKQSEEAYRIDKIRFKEGQISANDLIQSEAARSNAQGQLIAAKTQAILWNLKLQKAIGYTEPKV
ncbi:MAG: TolC family protein, partial [Oligoflexales bacterium]|nr:TolC family protein [Oligoflexales bacterium]